MDFDLPTVPHADQDLPGTMELGAFSVSLSVTDLARSRAFYGKLGFEPAGGDGESYLIMKNGLTTIGLFQGMFEGNILTFNPGLTDRMERLEEYLDVRRIQERLEEAGVEFIERVDPATESGPGHLTIVDPDGNPILIDQFF